VIYVGVILVAVGLAYVISSLVAGHYASKEDAQYRLTAPKAKSKASKLSFSKISIAGGILIAVIVFSFTHSLINGIIFGVGVTIALALNNDQAKDKLIEIQAVITYAQTVFPLLTSTMANTVVAERAAVALPPKMRALMIESIQDANTRNLSMREAMLMFAAKQQSQEIDVVMSVVAASFSANSEGFRRSSGDVVVKVFQKSLEEIASTVNSRHEVLLAGKLITFGIPALFVFMNTMFAGHFAPPAIDYTLAAAGMSLIVVASAVLSAILSRPLSSKRLIENDVLEEQIRAKTTILEDLS
jgi:hypothetical protein